MKEYTLQPNEVVLYDIKNVTVKEQKGSTSLTLTNLNFIFETTVKKLFNKNYTTTECFSVDTVKIYNDTPQVKQNASSVQIYFIGAERSITFPTKSEAHKFTSKALELLTGKNAFFRGIEKAKKTVAAVDESLGIDTLGIASAVVKTAVNTTTPNGKFTKAKNVIKFANGVIKQKETKQITNTSSTESNLETLKQLKALLDDGTITQEEFEIKKKELLSL